MSGNGPRPDEVAAVLARTEQALDPAAPERGGAVRVLGYGEISVALTLAELPGLVCKRMSGFADEASAARHVRLVEDYLVRLEQAGVRVAPTELVTIGRPGRPPVVYLVQPRNPLRREAEQHRKAGPRQHCREDTRAARHYDRFGHL